MRAQRATEIARLQQASLARSPRRGPQLRCGHALYATRLPQPPRARLLGHAHRRRQRIRADRARAHQPLDHTCCTRGTVRLPANPLQTPDW
jgi:hypothetical protein